MICAKHDDPSLGSNPGTLSSVHDEVLLRALGAWAVNTAFHTPTSQKADRKHRSAETGVEAPALDFRSDPLLPLPSPVPAAGRRTGLAIGVSGILVSWPARCRLGLPPRGLSTRGRLEQDIRPDGRLQRFSSRTGTGDEVHETGSSEEAASWDRNRTFKRSVYCR